MASGHRPLDSQSLRGRVTFPDGDHPVCPAFCPSGGLDGLHRSQGGLPTGSHPSGISSIPPLCGTWPYLSVHSAMLWPLHSPAGFFPGHGSCFCNPPSLGYSHASIPRRLACPVVLPRVSPPGPPGGTGPLSGAGHCHQPGEIQPRALSGCAVSWGGDRCPNFCGFSIARTHRQASINSWRISVLRRSSRQYLALATGHVVLDVPSSLWRSAPHALPTAVSPPVWGSSGSVNLDSLVSVLSSGSAVVAPLAPPFSEVSLRQVSPDLDFWSDASDVVWGAHLGHHTASALWSRVEVPLSINAKELLAVRRGLLHFQSSLVGKTVSVFCDNSTVVAYLRKEGGTRSPFLNSLAQGILRWSESLAIRLAPQFILGSLNVLADTLSRPHQLPHTEWPLNQDMFRSLSHLWPVQINLFATSENRQCSIFFSPFWDPLAAGTDEFLRSWDGLQAYAFPPWSIIPRVLAKLRESRGTELTLVAPYWPQRPWFSDLLHLLLEPPVVLPMRPDLLRLLRSRRLYQGLHRLHLHACRLSGASREWPDSLLQ